MLDAILLHGPFSNFSKNQSDLAMSLTSGRMANIHTFFLENQGNKISSDLYRNSLVKTEWLEAS